MSRQQSSPVQLNLFGNDEQSTPKTSTTFSDNLKLPIHRWFRYSAGFSALWVAETIKEAVDSRSGPVRVLDPFAGSGTVLVEAAEQDVESIGVESHPFVARIARVKTRLGLDPDGFRDYAQALLRRAGRNTASIESYPPLIRKCFPEEPLEELDRLRSAWLETVDSPYHDHGWLALAAILRQCSPVGTANWQYVLPKKTKAKVTDPRTAFKAKVAQIYADLTMRHQVVDTATLLKGDARELQGIPDAWATLVVTSPPYPNNFDYADATRLEMTFFGDVTGWGGLQDSVRKHLVREVDPVF